ncbi:hypothetical protein [Metabacillus iocasae]|uniref:Uncharacterized protein n=1 Tax=Priestia iocasae TaxID=2291674 RepID=A0ABS2QZC0_9BACI|nr:hypothetical protein [Metabacillus iocasae]MBM7704347.1 hypothetical protein [Metabacillus iocasae]
MFTIRRLTPTCPKCNGCHTYDVIPELPSEPQWQLRPFDFSLETYSVGNATYYCMDCEYKWKKYRGKKPYEKIKVIYAHAGGFPGPYHKVKVDVARSIVEYKADFSYDSELPVHDRKERSKEELEFFLAKLYTCDFMNWAEEYDMSGPVLDGTHWSIRIEYDTHCEMKRGSNHYPSKWATFCKAISSLSGYEYY